MENLRKSLSSEKEAAAPGYASPSPTERRRKRQKMQSLMPEGKAAAAPKKKREKKKKSKKKEGERMHDEEEKEQEEEKPSLYFVVQHAVKYPAYSLYKVEHTKRTAEHPVPVPCRIQFLDAQSNMSFVALSSARRSWIVGAGGYGSLIASGHGQSQTIVFDCKTGAVAKGPNLTESKYSPVVVAVGEKVYALSRMPSMTMPPDFPPWFEVLDLSGASCVHGELTDCTWYPLQPPPLFPIIGDGWSRVDRGPPVVDVESYAVVGHYILLSIVRDPFTEKDAGTVAFDTLAEQWLMLDKKNLPFVGQATPYGRLFLGRSRSDDWNVLTAYDISITETETTLMLSIMEIPVTVAMTDDTPPMISGQFFASLGNGVICAIGCYTDNWTGNEQIEQDNIYIHFHSPISEQQGQQAGKIVLSSTPAKYHLRLHESAYRLIAPSLVSAPCLTVI